MKRNHLFRLLPPSLLVSCFFLVASCDTIDVFEKNIAIPNHAWSSKFTPEVSFDINDTSSLYNIFVVIRHTDAYRYKNIWMDLTLIQPDSTVKTQKLELQLATDSKGWLGTGMDDLFEHRIPVTTLQKPLSLKKGTYRFKLTNVMREDPLEHVMNVGIRVEKAK